jgi:putative DNA methylase
MSDSDFKRKHGREDFGWYSRGYIPHFDGGSELPQFITFRLADSMPKIVIERWLKEGLLDIEFRKRIERYLDAGAGKCWLRQPAVAEIVRAALLYHNGSKYDLVVWVIMPNHVHLLLVPAAGVHLPEILHSIKSFTAQQANKLLNRSGSFWQRESFDRYIRNERHFRNVIKYIEENPVKARLCKTAGKWRYGSAFNGVD